MNTSAMTHFLLRPTLSGSSVAPHWPFDLLPYETQNVGQVQRIQWVQYTSITCGAQKVTCSDMLGIFGVDSSVSPVAELKMQRSRILAAGDCEEDRLVHSTTLVAEIKVQVVETSPRSGAQNKFEKNIQWLKYELALSCHVFTGAASTYKRWLSTAKLTSCNLVILPHLETSSKLFCPKFKSCAKLIMAKMQDPNFRLVDWHSFVKWLIFSWHNDMLHERAKIIGPWIVTSSNIPYSTEGKNEELPAGLRGCA